MSFKKCKVVMLSTNEKAMIGLNYNNLFYCKGNNMGFENSKHINSQHLYITSDEEIKEGDWIFDNYSKINLIQQVRVCDLESSHNRNGNWHKIIATTNEQLRIDSIIRSTQDDDYGKVKFIIAKPSQQFIEKYIEEYNKGNVITDVLVEYIDNGEEGWNGSNEDGEPIWNEKIELKVNPKDNTITIKKVKDSWNREEIIELIRKYHSSFATYPTMNLDLRDNWIETNL